MAYIDEDFKARNSQTGAILVSGWPRRKLSVDVVGLPCVYEKRQFRSSSPTGGRDCIFQLASSVS